MLEFYQIAFSLSLAFNIVAAASAWPLYEHLKQKWTEEKDREIRELREKIRVLEAGVGTPPAPPTKGKGMTP